MGEIATLRDVLEADAPQWWPKERHEVVRRGERAPIPAHVRSAVYLRDGGRCEMCPRGSELGLWHLDHIVPWSAGGSDDTTNLRILCEKHNLERSNWPDVNERRGRRAATWWCLNCYDRDGFGWEYPNGLPICPTHGWAVTGRFCRVSRGYLRAKELTGELPTWHQRDPITTAGTIAYCAHCDAPGLTDRPL